jgi:cytochrome c oxidase assembly protein subunit 15
VGAVASAVLVLGTVVTGSGPHSGDADEPARFGFDPATVSWLHADAVWLFVGLVVALLLALSLTGESPRALRRTRMLLAVTLAQGLVGYTQYFTDLPAGLVALHMLGASVLVIATTATLHAVLVPAGARPAAGAGVA